MKKIYIFLLGFSLLMWGCRKDFEVVNSVPVVFQLDFPDSFTEGAVPEGVRVNLRNNITGEVLEVLSDENGQIVTPLLPGTYSLNASRSYTPAESEALSGYEGESFVNASVSPIIVREAATVNVPLLASVAGGLVIREFYYAGVPPNYFYDAFIEIYNNTGLNVYLDSLYIGNTKSASAAAHGFQAEQDSAYLLQVWMVPGSGEDHILEPGESFIIAMTALNHRTDPLGNPNSPVNLGPGISDFETYWPYANRDTDVPDVPNLVHAHAGTTAGFDWLPGVFGTGLVIFKTDDFDSLPDHLEPNVTSQNRYKAIPVSDIWDGVDCVRDATITSDQKRLPVGVDAGMVTVGGSYNGRSVRRKVREVVDGRTIFQDTNNSSQDFEVNNTPSPRNWN